MFQRNLLCCLLQKVVRGEVGPALAKNFDNRKFWWVGWVGWTQMHPPSLLQDLQLLTQIFIQHRILRGGKIDNFPFSYSQQQLHYY